MTDEELLKMAYDALADEGDTVKKSIAMHKIMVRLENRPRPISGQALVDAIMAHEEERRDGFHLSTYSFIHGIRFAEKRFGIQPEGDDHDR